jgi:hypothetical protein
VGAGPDLSGVSCAACKTNVFYFFSGKGGRACV